MNEKYYGYEMFARTILAQFPIMRTGQFDLMLANKFDTSLEAIANVKYELQFHHVLLISSDSYIMTPAMYMALSNQKTYKWKNTFANKPKLEDVTMLVKQFGFDINKTINSLWVLADMIAGARNITKANDPFDITFLTEPEVTENRNVSSKLFEIVYIPKNMPLLMDQLATEKTDALFEEFKTNIRRIAIVEDPDDAPYVPHNGFTHIVKLDHKNKDTHYVILEARTGASVWEDEPK